jgi:hypothetical protein
MRAGAQSDDGDATIDRSGKFFARGFIPMAETQQHDDGIGGIERFGMAQTATSRGINGAVGSKAEEHGAFETVALAEDLAEHGHGFLAAVFLIAGKQDDVFSFGLTDGFIDDVIGSEQAGCGEKRKYELFHDGWWELAKDETYAH